MSRAMKPRVAGLILAGLWLIIGSIASAQSISPGRAGGAEVANPAAEPAAKGVIRGRIFGPNARPLTRAQVQLVNAESGRSLGFASTDEEGRFEFTQLAAGDYRLSAGKAGYLVM